MKNKGFTLVELLVVIAIMAILTVITVAQFETARKKARDAQRKGDINSVTKALQMYFTDYGRLPSADDINDLLTENGGSREFTDASGYVYMKMMPKETKAGWPPYCYEVDSTTNPKKFAIYTMLENTADSDCHLAVDKTPLYKSKCDPPRDYCFALTSPNAALNAEGDLE